MNPLSGPVQVFHIGRPDQEEPHKNMERVEKFHRNNPEAKLVVFLQSEKDVEEFKPKVTNPNCEIVHWCDDTVLMNWLMERIATIMGTRIVWPQWWICPDLHVTAFDYTKAATDQGKCETCNAACTLVQPLKDTVEAFTALFSKVILLVNFDTRSGEHLFQQVNPTVNVLKNMPAALGCRHEPSLSLRGAHKGKPALICAAGPSLDKAIPDLLRLQEHCVISCVGRVFKKLRKAGVRVDYTVSVEMFDWDSAIFDGLTKDDVGDTVLAFASVCAPATVAKWPGRKYCLWDIETAKLMGRDDHILGGNSVAHHQLNFAAQILECEPIILVGNDLAYTEPRTHATESAPEAWPNDVKKQDEGYHAEEKWVPCTGKGGALHPECHRVITALGGGGFAISGQMQVRSSQPYENFATLFGILISKHGKRIYNGCPNGQKIPGAEYLDLATWEPARALDVALSMR